MRGSSVIQGDGVFAAESITKNTRIIDYAGELVRNDEACEAREERYREKGELWVFRVNRAWSRDAYVGGNIARFINHSCHPNCYVQISGGRIWIRAARKIRKGEEITYHYNTDGEALIKCRCRPRCQSLL